MTDFDKKMKVIIEKTPQYVLDYADNLSQDTEYNYYEIARTWLASEYYKGDNCIYELVLDYGGGEIYNSVFTTKIAAIFARDKTFSNGNITNYAIRVLVPNSEGEYIADISGMIDTYNM